MNARSPRRPWRWIIAAIAAGAMVLGTANVASASVSTVPDSTATVTGTVYAIARIGNRTIIGGDFTAVGGVARRNAAAIRADGTVDPNFIPNPNGTVLAIAVSSQPTRVFLGGTFTRVGGVPRARLAAVKSTTGATVRTWYAGANGSVETLAAAGPALYVGGTFTRIGGVERRRIASVSTSTRAVQPFNPSADWTVKAIAVSPGRSRVYAVGGFAKIGERYARAWPSSSPQPARQLRSHPRVAALELPSDYGPTGFGSTSRPPRTTSTHTDRPSRTECSFNGGPTVMCRRSPPP